MIGLQLSFLPFECSQWGHRAVLHSLCPSLASPAPVPISPLKHTRAQRKNEQSNWVGSECETRASDNNLELNLWPVSRSALDPVVSPCSCFSCYSKVSSSTSCPSTQTREGAEGERTSCTVSWVSLQTHRVKKPVPILINNKQDDWRINTELKVYYTEHEAQPSVAGHDMISCLGSQWQLPKP